MSLKKIIPKFKSEAAERVFWSKHDSTDFIDYSKAKKVLFPNLRPSLKTISIRLPESLFRSLKVLAHKNDVPYQSLMKMFLSQKIGEELHLTKRGQGAKATHAI